MSTHDSVDYLRHLLEHRPVTDQVSDKTSGRPACRECGIHHIGERARYQATTCDDARAQKASVHEAIAVELDRIRPAVAESILIANAVIAEAARTTRAAQDRHDRAQHRRWAVPDPRRQR